LGKDMQGVQMLPLVLVQALYLDIEQRIGTDLDPCALCDESSKINFVVMLDTAPLFPEDRIVGKRLEPFQLLEIP